MSNTLQEEKNLNPAAFPVAMSEQTFSNQESAPYQEGMTLRDYFAAKAMQGILSNPNWMKEYNGEKYLMKSEIIAQVSHSIADAMLEQRNKV